eukprot:TRINITY_DN11305_c0_g1_i2.p1 TRINITY_DN11305_c0_g1~~TRINITY_DN11305_c0_g1_i2.p1  ORF type:complete len:396 (+),score=97.71 TRINITY_DN11305_c0_g1_i2:134-1321(+)
MCIRDRPSVHVHAAMSGQQDDPEALPSPDPETALHHGPPTTPNQVPEELPAVAAFRRQAMLDVMRSICTVETSSSDPCKHNRHGSRFLTRKVAADVFNKWVFQTHATGSSSAERTDGYEGWTRSGKPLDPVIPSCENTTLTQYIERQLISGYDVSSEIAEMAAAQLSQQCIEAAQRVHSFAQAQKRWWARAPNSARQLITDSLLGVELSTVPDSEGDVDPMVQITWRGCPHSDQGPEHCQLWKSHFDQLRAKYMGGGHDPARMLSRILVMVLRYETLSEVKSAYQAALPKEVVQVMQSDFGVRCECFASPLNCYCDNFCSLFPDTDSYFGSRGSFFDYAPDFGSYECNPPFDQMSVLNTFTHILKLLRDSEELYQPLSFIVTTCLLYTSPSPRDS